MEHQAVFTVPFVKEYNGNLGSGVCGVGTSDAYVSAKKVSHGQDGILPILLG